MSHDEPIYESKPTMINLRQRYLVYADRVELHLRLGRKMIIPKEDILVVDRRDKALIFDLAGGHPHFSRPRALQLDMSDLKPHVALVKTTGVWQQLRFSPHDPEAFVEACKSILPPENFIPKW